MSRIDNRPKVEIKKKKEHVVKKFMSDAKHKEETIRQTYYLPIHLAKAMAFYAACEKKSLSELATKLLKKSIPKKYIEMADDENGDLEI